MNIKIDDVNLSYDIGGNGKTIVLLHGWASSKEVWNNVYNYLLENYRVIKIDLLGFGNTKIEKEYYIDDVVIILHKFLEFLNIENPIVIGHSYGGRIAIKYASLYNIDRLILVSTPFLVSKPKFKEKVYKFFKRMHINLKMGSRDYKNASPILRNMLVNAIKTDLKDSAVKLNCPTLLIWGENDKTVEYNDILALNECVKDSGIVVIKNAGHFPFLDEFMYFVRVISYFLECDNVV